MLRIITLLEPDTLAGDRLCNSVAIENRHATNYFEGTPPRLCYALQALPAYHSRGEHHEKTEHVGSDDTRMECV